MLSPFVALLAFVAPPLLQHRVDYARTSIVRAAASSVAENPAVFHRASDMLSVKESVSAVDVVNVLGRWQTWQQWDGIGNILCPALVPVL